MIRCDEEGVPCLVQRWFGTDEFGLVEFFDGSYLIVCPDHLDKPGFEAAAEQAWRDMRGLLDD